MRKIIGIDIDSVLADSDKIFTGELEKITGRKLNRWQNPTFKYEEAFNIDEKTMERFWDEFTQKKGWLQIPIMDGAVETVKRLKENNYYIIVVSARPPQIKSQTVEWLNINNIPYDELFLTNYQNKTNFITHIDHLHYFLEDHPDFALQFAKKGITVLLFDWPWNQGIEHEKIKRVKNWKEVQKILFKSNFNK